MLKLENLSTEDARKLVDLLLELEAQPSIQSFLRRLLRH